ncbi:[protein-PII] uridylyltransferase family protein [Hydrogenothermus marinus]|uniref:Glutamate-ammonia-ligase adenylyltransferase n=1 Tax=Hydrogenothermus marinus TaxID=133270 RepID=A0A3M0CB60_9AQUI|nr:glutamine-synthetase adenylyltransferase [Hydrogenothermus marinus]RMB00263.1 glutamate-ammonia-ligase adenylyltransferase [Hydrogenothermus marinus]
MEKFELLKKDFIESLSKEKKQFLKDLTFYSKCLRDFLLRHEEYLDYFYENLDLDLLGREKLIKEATKLLDISSENEFITNLTIFKMKHFGRIVSKDIYNKHTLPELMKEYSYVADATLEIAFQRSWQIAEKKYGKPLDNEKNPVYASVIALGKLGGLELNYYSDIDLMYIYDNEGKTEKGFTNKEFFSFLFSKLNQFLTKRNIEGQTWIIDLDLRPNGKSGFIAYSLPALETYYWTVGRVWERHMLIKARHSAGNKNTTEEFLKIVKPFVYKSFTSKDEIKEIIEMKKLIEKDALSVNKDEFDLKKGDGGIREVEFTAQILQLIYAGKDKYLQERSTYKTIQKLKERGILTEEDADILTSAYLFYRKLEHIIQIENCQQTQKFKYKNADIYAKKLNLKDGNELLEKLNDYREKVKKIFNSLQLEDTKELSPLQKYIFTKHNEDEALNYLASIGFKDPKWALSRIKEIFFSKDFILLSEDFKEALFNFLPELEKQLKEYEYKTDFLKNLTNMLIEGKMLPIFASAILQNKKLVEFILNIAKVSDYISNLMAKDPELLDFAFGVEDILKTKQDFEKELELIKSDNFLEKLNKLKNIVQVLASLRYISQIHLDNAEERLLELNQILTNLADFIIEKIYKHETKENIPIVIYGLGKLGSKEMNIGSDLDLIFSFSDINAKQKYEKIPVNIIKSLTKYTRMGILYQIDLRLRPYGKSGELSPTINYYEKYFKNEARSWERLAWTKARFITGDISLKEKMEKLIEDFLFSKTVDNNFIYDIYEMRMRLEGISNEKSDEIDIKLGYGGIVDLEFLAQLKALKEKIRIRSTFKIIKDYYPEMIDKYIFLREVETRLRMIKATGISRIGKNSPYIYRLAKSFNLDEEKLWKKILETRKDIRRFFLKNVKEKV